ncbi:MULTISPECIES: amidohydrolase family protein [Cytobacillus]|uniref:amidohydrolase family protein n=1 Tax=Cytobacillus TaxID=2675230 RepID=UPI00204048E2|nr:amidohydrolase family protein [Cytobacillus firmus]MCM3706623.1 amidohydrolase [Cytobacillus firmus]
MHDFHTHFIPQEVLDWIKENQTALKAERVKKSPDKDEFLIINNKWGFELKPEFYHFDLYSNKQFMAGVTHSLISPIPQLFMYEFPQEITAEISNIYNQALAMLASLAPEKTSALATVALNNPDMAAAELERSMNLGLKGAIIGPGLSDKMLSDEFFSPLFEMANSKKAILFIHPLLSEDPRLKTKMMPNLIGVPWETTVCATDILLSGMIDKYPDVKILFAHGGGFLPYQIGRLDKGYEQWDQVSSNLKAPPSQYIKRFWFDSVLWNSSGLDFLVKTVGENRVVPGSDYPFDLSETPPKYKNTAGASSLLETFSAFL